MAFYYLLFFVLFLSIVIIFYYFNNKNKYKLSKDKKKYFLWILKNIKNIKDSKEIIIDSDKLYHKILNEVWYKWTFWEILKQKPIVIKNLNKIWEYHKIRNSLVHDFEKKDHIFLKKQANSYLNEIDYLLKLL